MDSIDKDETKRALLARFSAIMLIGRIYIASKCLKNGKHM